MVVMELNECFSCKIDLPKNAGRYVFDDQTYCPSCWDTHQKSMPVWLQRNKKTDKKYA